MAAIDIYLIEIRKFPPLTREEEKQTIINAKNGDKQAYELLIKSNLRFVVSTAKKYQGQGVDLEDLISEGNLGLVKAYEKFDISRNYKFITYAVWWIRQSIINLIHEHSRAIRIPVNKITNITKGSRIKDIREQFHGREVSLSEILDEFPEIAEDLRYNFLMLDLDEPQTDDENDLNSVIEDVSYELELEIEKLNIELKTFFKKLTPREREVICMYYGIGHERAYTLQDIGEVLDLTRERIRQIKLIVLDKFKKNEVAEILKDFL